MKLLHSLCRRWFPSCSQGLFALFTVTLVGGSWVQYIALRPSHYGLPILMGLALLLWGFAFWVDATAEEQIKPGKALLGSFLLALIVAARPQLLISALLVLALIVAHLRTYGVGKSIKTIALCLIPVLAVFAVQGWYNYIRFGSIFDFGATYNLTLSDMTHRGWDWWRVPLALLAYFLQPPSIGASAPFLRHPTLTTDYHGITIAEPMFGGIFWLTPLLLVLFMLLFKKYRAALPLESRLIALTGVLAALIVSIFDAQVAGVLPRYLMDIGIFLALPAVLVIGSIWGSAVQPLSNDASIASEERIVTTDNKASFTTAGAVLMLLLVGSVLPILLVALGQ